MGAAVVSAVVSFVVEELGNWIKDEVGLSIDVKKEVRKLHSKFTAIRARLRKAENKQFADETVQDWLRKIKEVVYEVEDILDEWRTDALISQREKVEIGNQRTGGFHSLFSRPRPSFKRRKLHHETGQTIRELTERIDGISKEKIDFSWNGDHNIEEVELMSKMKARETGSLIDESMVFGRDGIKEIIINELISDNNREQKSVSITSIVGMGGLGKTTLAQLVCNDESVKTHFKKIIWVCVSDPFDVNKIATEVIESMGGSYPKNPNLNTLQLSLREAVSKMPFLLVLDDVWNEDKTQWEKLRVPLMGATQGSKILITTRSHKAAEAMETTHFHDLELLSHSDCWKLFKSIAFKGAEDEEFQELTEVGEDIVRWRCKGLPLAVRAVGSLLGSRRKYGYWKHILDSRIWDCDDDILPALLLSYYSLPFHLKRCFSFCSLFPKDYLMNKDELVQLWMAHGLIESKKAGTKVDHLEEIGEMYFDDLLARSLFQDAKEDENGNIYRCKMHDLVHDLATRVTDGEYRYIENEDSPPTNCHHLSFLRSHNVSSIPSQVCEATRLRTLLMLSDIEPFVGRWSEIKAIPNNLFNHLRFLRALDVSYTLIENLPSSISELKHLRYLNLSGMIIEELPESVTDLCNLQTLKLNWCSSLCFLPSGMSKMVQLRHLEIEGTDDLTFLPNGLGNLTTLRTLSEFPVGDENRGCKIGELKNLNLLRGGLVIENLERVLNVNEAREAQLNTKSYLRSLLFNYKEKTDEEWRMSADGEMEMMEGVFEGLGPLPSNLKKLEIYNYAGSKFSSWLEDFQSLTELVLWDCRKLRLLPSLGNLCSLKSLEIVRANEVKVVGDEFCGNGAGRGRVFPKLEFLSFEQMENWEEWKLTDEYGEVMPSLEKLDITNCNKLKALPDRLPRNLRRVNVHCKQFTWMPCDALPLLEFLSLEGLLKVELSPFPALKTLRIRFSSYETLPSDGWELLESLHTIEIEDCPRLEFLPDGMGKLKALQTLSIGRCSQLTNLPDGMGKLKALQTLSIHDCSQLTNLPEGLGQLKALQTLSIGGCSQLTNLPEGLGQLKALQTLSIGGCSQLTNLPEGLGQLKALQTLSICYCSQLTNLPEGLGQLKALQTLSILNCNQLTNLPEGLGKLKALQTLSIHHCSQLTNLPKGLGQLKALQTLSICYCSQLTNLPEGLGQLKALQTLSILNCNQLTNLPEGLGKLKALQTLSIGGCSQLTNLPEGLGQLETLRGLTINDCNGFTSLINGSGQFKTLRRLGIISCDSLRSLSDGLVHLEALQSVSVSGCDKLQSLFDGFEQLKSLRILRIRDCPELKHFPPLQYLTTLESLQIYNCPLVKEQLEKEIREDRCSVSHICKIEIDRKRIQ